MTRPWFTDMRMLVALRDSRDAPPVLAAERDAVVIPVSEAAALAGDMDLQAARLGVDVATLVRMRAEGRGQHRRPVRPLGEIFARLTWRKVRR